MHVFPFNMEQIVSLLQLQVKRRNSYEIDVNCPFCVGSDGRPDKNGHLNVDLEKDVFRCNRCNIKGGMLDLYGLYLGKTRKEALDEIMERLHCDNANYQPKIKPVQVASNVASKVASLEDRNNTYGEFLKILNLSSVHKDNLLKRGLTIDEIHKRGYKTLPIIGLHRLIKELLDKGCKLNGVPGFYKNDNDEWMLNICGSGILVPVRDDVGNIQGLQIRNDTGKRRYTWLTSKKLKDGTQASSYLHYTNMDLVTNGEVFITEGPLKADIASYFSRKPFIALAGSSCYEVIEKNVEKLKWYGIDTIVNAMDMDRYTNVSVMNNVAEMQKTIENNGFKLINLKWDHKFKGIDDYLWDKKQSQRRN